MSWLLDIKKTKKETKYRMWSTIVDDYINDKWLTEAEIKKFLFWEYFREFMHKATKEVNYFPHGWFSKKEEMRIYTQKFLHKSEKDFDDNEFVEEFCKKMKEIGVDISVSDGQHGFDSKKK